MFSDMVMRLYAGGFESTNNGRSSASVGINKAIWFMDVEEPVALASVNPTKFALSVHLDRI